MQKLKSFYLTSISTAIILSGAMAQKASTIEIKQNDKQIEVLADGKPFTSLMYPDSVAKHFLYPIVTPGGKTVTRGFPIAPRPNEATDHPHHVGLWLNYESVNGLDFWNNSFAIPEEKREKYGWIKTNKIVKAKGGKKGEIKLEAAWENQKQQVLMNENTTYFFKAQDNVYIIDRVTSLNAKQDIFLADVKDGFLGLRVGRELELPSKETKTFTDASGIATTVEGAANTIAGGNYLNSQGIEGEDVWAKRANWCMLYGKQGDEVTSIVIFDNPRNPGYPTYWHARGYGLFAANPLGQKVFSDGKESLNLQLKQGQTVTFRYRIVIASGAEKLSNGEISTLAGDFYQTVK